FISILESGVLDEVDAIFGNHLWVPTPLGEVTTKPGPFMAGVASFTITVKGKGGHGGYPHETKDAIVIASEITTQIQNIISRKIYPFATSVITIGKFEGGTSFNVIADEAKQTGNSRDSDHKVDRKRKDNMEQVRTGTCIANEAAYEFVYEDGYPPVVNHEEETDIVLQAAESITAVQSGTIAEGQM